MQINSYWFITTLFTGLLSIVAFRLQYELSAYETVCKTTKPKSFTIWPFLEKSFWYLFFETRLSVHMKHRGKAYKLNNHDEAVRQIQNIGNFSNVSTIVNSA